jgi:thioredoxin 1
MTAEVTDATFDTLVNESTVPVLVDFWAPWCGPCRASAPHVDKLAAETAGKLTVVKMNTDENQEIPSRYGITAIPTFMLFLPKKTDAPAARKVTMMDLTALRDFIAPHVKAPA